MPPLPPLQQGDRQRQELQPVPAQGFGPLPLRLVPLDDDRLRRGDGDVAAGLDVTNGGFLAGAHR